MTTEPAHSDDAKANRLYSGLTYLGRKLSVFKGDRLGQAGLFMLLFVVFVGIFARPITVDLFGNAVTLQPFSLAPHDPTERFLGPRLSPPSLAHPLGTNHLGQDVLSRTLWGARVSLIVGGIAAFIAVFIGTNIGLIGGYVGGWVDDLLMRITDIAYGLPFLPIAIAIVAIMGQSLAWIILAIVLIQWRSTARVIRSQVLSHKQRPYVESAQAIGASHFRILYIHILPNVFPLVFLYAAFAVGYAVIAEASLSFLGLGPAQMISWGGMIYNAFLQDAIREAWWWVFPPGIMIMTFVMSVFFIGRSLEKLVDPELRHTE